MHVSAADLICKKESLQPSMCAEGPRLHQQGGRREYSCVKLCVEMKMCAC